MVANTYRTAKPTTCLSGRLSPTIRHKKAIQALANAGYCLRQGVVAGMTVQRMIRKAAA
jgi:hypothetical protein